MNETELTKIVNEIQALNKKLDDNESYHAYLQKRLLSLYEACKYLGIGSTEGYAKLRSHVRTIKHGKRILIPKEELDALIERAKKRGALFD